jgi:hypothetical protein
MIVRTPKCIEISWIIKENFVHGWTYEVIPAIVGIVDNA